MKPFHENRKERSFRRPRPRYPHGTHRQSPCLFEHFLQHGTGGINRDTYKLVILRRVVLTISESKLFPYHISDNFIIYFEVFN